MENKYIIKMVKCRWVLDSRGWPTVETDIITENNICGRAIVPSGASTGEYEAIELRDQEERFLGKGVNNAVRNVNDKIRNLIVGKDVRDQKLIDNSMIDLDGTDNKSNLGANAILSVSLATAVAAAKVSDMELFDYLYKLYRKNQNLEPDYYLPTPMCNVLNGGVHAGNNLSVQEFMLVPIGADSYKNAIVMVSEIYQYLKKKIRSKYGKTAINLGDEGGFAPNLNYTHEALDLLIDAIDESGYIKNKEIFIALDSAASEFLENGKYKIDEKYLSPGELVDYYVELINKYPIISIEDPFEENDFNSHSLLVQKIGSNVQIVGDDLFVTQVKRIKKGIEEKSANALLLKVNQVGSLTESLEAARICQENGLNVIVSHRSGETEDTFIADLSVGLSFNKIMIKSGAPARSERTAKYNRLIRIAEKISNKASYSGKKF